MGKRKFAIFILFFIVMTIALPYSSKAVPLDSYWNWRNPLPQGIDLNKIEYLNGMFVAVGAYGTIVTSTDGVNWTVRDSLTDEELIGVAYGSGVFVALSYFGTIPTSPDAGVWTVRKSGQDKLNASILHDVSYLNGVFVVKGKNEDNTAIVYTSSDGVEWVLTILDGYHHIGPIISGNGIYLTSGTAKMPGPQKILVSPDGISWTIAHMPETFQYVSSMIYANGIFLIWGAGSVYTSLNGLDWAEHLTVDTDDILDVAFGNGTFVAVKSMGQIDISPNGLYWLNVSGLRDGFADITYGDGVFAAVGWRGTIATSTDGLNWTSHVARVTRHDLRDVVYGNNTFVAVGSGDSRTVMDNYILTSPGGVNWKVIPVTSRSLGRIAFLNGTFIALGYDGDLLTSSDGLNWRKATSGTTAWLNEAAHGNGIFVVVGRYDTVLTSSDSIAWILRHSGLSVNFDGITYAKGIFVASGHIPDFSAPCGGYFLCPPPSYGTILTSTDGINWTQRYLDTNYSSFSPVEYRNDEFVVVDPLDDTVLTSPDGINWTTKQTNIPPTYCVPWEDIGIWDIASVTYGNNTFLAVGAYGTILQSNFLGSACAAILSSSLALHVPIIDFNGTYLWGNADCEGRADGNVMCRVTDYGEASPDAFSDCQPSRLSSDFALQVPSGIYNNIPYRADFEYLPTGDGQLWFKLSNHCPY